MEDCRRYGTNCDVSALEDRDASNKSNAPDTIIYDERVSAFPFDHEVYDYYQEEHVDD
jgi:hypothetical protein